MTADDFRKLIGWVIVLVSIAVVAVAALSYSLVRPAHGSQVCLTKKEARALWPKRHLYWYGPDHCWSNRRGRPSNLRYDLIRENHAESLPATPVQDPGVKVAGGDRVAQLPSPPDTVSTKTDLDPWPPAAKPIRVIEIVRPSTPLPVRPVEAEDLEPPPQPLTPPSNVSILAPLGGALAAILLAFLVPFRERILFHVKRTFDRIHHRALQAGAKVRAACLHARDQQPPFPALDIRHFIRRAERAGRLDHLAKVLARVEDAGADPCDEWREPDDSALACWSRRVRAQENS